MTEQENILRNKQNETPKILVGLGFDQVESTYLSVSNHLN